jgi:tRNA G18 (ribose-2'-O)-methylase SpoU
VAAQLITDADDERIADYRALTDVELRTRWEPPHGLFIAEGELVLRRALRAGYRPRSFLVDQKRIDQVADLMALGVPVYAASQELLQETTGFHVHRGVLASFHRRPLPEPAEVLVAARRVAVLEDLNNHTNLGAIFRGAAALGIDAVLLSPSCADPLYRRSVRVSMGEVFAVPYARLAPWPAALALVREAGFTLLALTPAAFADGPSAISHSTSRKTGHPHLTSARSRGVDEEVVPIQRLGAAERERAALLLGAEGPGLSRHALAGSDRRVSIPMRRGVDSLNVAAAAAVAFWELGRGDQNI